MTTARVMTRLLLTGRVPMGADIAGRRKRFFGVGGLSMLQRSGAAIRQA
jgi:hypothetical protein